MKLKMILLILICMSMFACAPVQEGPKTSGEVMKVAYNYFPGQFWIEVADSQGWFEEAGLNVQLVDTNDDYFQGLQDTVDGKIDINMLVLFDLMDVNLQGANLVGVINSDVSSGADGLVVKDGINYVSDLRGKKIGVQKGTFTEFMVNTLLARKGISIGDVTLVEVPSDTADPFINGDVDALLTWEPYLTEAVNEKNGRIIFDSATIPGLIPDLIVLKKDIIEKRPEDVQSLVNVWHKTTEYMKLNQDETFGIIAQKYQISLDEVKEFANNAKILDLSENRKSFLFSNDFDSLHGTARKINDFMIEKGITDEQLDSTAFLDARFIRGVEK